MKYEYLKYDEILKLLNEIDEDLFKQEQWKESVIAEIEKVKGLNIVHCKDCDTFNRQGVADGYGWCKKFCFGPNENYFCKWATREDM